jgi:Flp pilus assembly protein TadD
VPALTALGIVRKRLGDWEQAQVLYQRAMDIDPHSVEAHYNLAILFMEQFRDGESEHHFAQVLARRPGHAGACDNLARVFERRGQWRQAGRILRDGLGYSPDHHVLLYHLSWLLATAPDPDARDGQESLALAERLAVIAGAEPEACDALAAAYAEVGRQHEAIEAASRAVALAVERHRPELAREISQRLALYTAGQPFRQEPKN